MDAVLVDARRIDERGRVVIPRTVRAMLDWQAQDAVRIFVQVDRDRVILQRVDAAEASSDEYQDQAR